MSGSSYTEAFPTPSSSSHSPTADTPTSDDRDELDYLGHDLRRPSEDEVLRDDPARSQLNSSLSFKRKTTPSLLSAPARFLSSLTGSQRSRDGSLPRRSQSSPPLFEQSDYPSGGGTQTDGANVAKDGTSLDWHIEGPGRRVGYEDLTAIDWIFEYTKERQRLRMLSSSASGVLGHVVRLLDASQVWIVLLLTGVLVGGLAAGIDITTDWLGDLKLGYCSSGPEGGHFYLSKSFCCYGYDQGSACAGWTTWSEGIGIHASGGQWFVQYFFYLIISVCRSQGPAFSTISSR